MEFPISHPKVVRLPRNEKQTYQLNSRPQMWPMGLTLTITLTFEFWRSDMTLTFDHTWSWPWIFMVKFWNSSISQWDSWFTLHKFQFRNWNWNCYQFLFQFRNWPQRWITRSHESRCHHYAPLIFRGKKSLLPLNNAFFIATAIVVKGTADTLDYRARNSRSPGSQCDEKWRRATADPKYRSPAGDHFFHNMIC